MHLLRALLYLRLQSIRNVLGVRLRRLKQPKYLFGLLAGLAYFWFFFLRHAGRTGPGGAGPALSAVFGGHLELIAAAVLSLFVLLIWVLPQDHPGLAFTEAEVAFLFPAPLTRRQLIQYKLLDGLALSLFGAMFFTLLSNGLRLGLVGALLRLGAWWSLNANLSLHQTAAALTISRLTRAGFGTIARRIVFVAGAAGILAVMIFIAVNSGIDGLKWLLLPARLAVAPFLATTPGEYLLALLPAFGLVAVHYFWVLQMESPFEDATLVRARKRGETVARLREGRGLRIGSGPTKARREPFRLRDRLPPEFALLWKNLMAAPSYLNRHVFASAAIVLTYGVLWLQGHMPPIANGVGFGALAFLAYVLAFGPQLARNDLRGDLLNIDMFKAYPLPGWRIMLGSLLAPAVALTAIGWLLVLVAALGLRPSPQVAQWCTPQFRVTAALAVAAVLPALSAVQLLVPNAATLIFPAWAQTTRHASGGGVDVLGQRLIFMAGQMLCLLAAVLPAVLVAGGTIFVTQWLIGLPAATALAVLPVLGIFILEVGLGVYWLGPKFERLDISAELRP
jgi:hypothetical protein